MENKIVNCEFSTLSWCLNTQNYTCTVSCEVIKNNLELKFRGTHGYMENDNDVQAILFDKCSLSAVPQGLKNQFPNLRFIEIRNSKLKVIERKDLQEYSNCICFAFSHNEIEYLPGDLFIGMRHLEVIWFADNKIQMIEPNLFDNLTNLKIVDLRGNPCINKYHDLTKNERSYLKKIKKEIREKFGSPFHESIFKLLKKSKEIKPVQVKKEEVMPLEVKQVEVKPLEVNGIWSDVRSIIQNEKFKDFTVKVEDEEFKVHKFLLAARSSVLAEMIKNNIDAEELNLTDISTAIFREILNFIYTDELPKLNQINFMHLFTAAGQLKIEKLKYTRDPQEKPLWSFPRLLRHHTLVDVL